MEIIERMCLVFKNMTFLFQWKISLHEEDEGIEIRPEEKSYPTGICRVIRRGSSRPIQTMSTDNQLFLYDGFP